MGIMQTGLIFSKCCSRIGLHVFDIVDYPSLIRGGHNTYHIRAEDEEVRSQIYTVNILIALDEATLNIHCDELGEESLVIYDEKRVKPEQTRLHRGIRCPLPLIETVKELGAEEVMKNTVALGAALGMLDYPMSVFEGIIKDAFKGKKQAVIKENIAAAKKGYALGKERYRHQSSFTLTPVTDAPKRMVVTGNEAIALGAVKAGLKLYAAYPMTPASSILHTLAAWQERHDILVKQTEDEVGTINLGIGAGYAGVRAMVGTSGGGFALMQEGISLAGITETPIVIVEVQRGGPGTGIPTFSEQADLRFVMHAGHGDFPKIVLAPGDVEEAFHLTTQAFNLAEKYQTPVIIISDKHLGESHRTAPLFDTGGYRVDRGKLLREAPENYLRYLDQPDGISPRTIPGVKNGFFVANSDEHEPFGYSCEEIPNRNQQMEKRMRKLETLKAEIPEPEVVGDEEAELTLVSWGSTKGAVLDALTWLRKDGHKVNYLHLNWVTPFPAEAVKRILSAAKRTLLLENNYTAQMGGVIRQETGIGLPEQMLRYDGRPFYPEDIYQRAASMLGGGQ